MPGSVFVVAGTDTGVGKTVFSAMLTLALDGCYWKPVQSGAQEGTDTELVKQLTGLPEARFLPESYLLGRPLSPHRAAELDATMISLETLTPPPAVERPLIIELAGGLLVPLTRSHLQIELLESWKAPVILCARTSLGTINHSLLSCEALRHRGIPILGIAFIGESDEDSEKAIAAFAAARRLGRLPRLESLNAASLMKAFTERFALADFAAQPAPR